MTVSNGAGDTLTILYSADVQASKGAGPIRLGYWLAHESIYLPDFASLVDTLGTLADMPSAYVVRGIPIDPTQTPIRRRSRTDPIYLRDATHRWLCVDIDARPTRHDIYAETEDAVRAIRSRLPDGLRQAMCYYAITRRAEQYVFHGHLWFWLDRPYGDRELHRHLSGLCDVSLFQPAQPHFTAAPAVADDPLHGRRRGILDGIPTGYLGVKTVLPDPTQVESELEAAIDEISTQRKGDRHRTINRRAYHLGRHVASGQLDKGRAILVLTNAAKMAGLEESRANDEVLRGLNDGQRAAEHREEWQSRLQLTAEGAPRSSYFNVALALSDSPDWFGALGFNLRTHKTCWRRDPPIGGFVTAQANSDWCEEHALIAAEWLGQHGMVVSRGTIQETVADLAHRMPYDPICDILDECDWDGEPRLDDWLITYCGVAKHEWARLIGPRWLISGVARAYEPGCKADNILILEGEQGAFKSTALDILGLGYTKEIRVRLDDKDASDAIHSGAFIAVLTELEAFKRTHGNESIKSYLSALEDYFRRAYARITTTHKRSIIFAATTNEEAYLSDPTGNRRFWPVHCGRIDIEALERDVYQIWAEARQRYLEDAIWWLEGNTELATQEQAARLLPDSWEEYVRSYCQNKESVTLSQVMKDGLDMGAYQQTDEACKRVIRYLNRLGYGLGRRSGQRVYVRDGLNATGNGGE